LTGKISDFLTAKSMNVKGGIEKMINAIQFPGSPSNRFALHEDLAIYKLPLVEMQN
jgi:hypothetical protein